MYIDIWIREPRRECLIAWLTVRMIRKAASRLPCGLLNVAPPGGVYAAVAGGALSRVADSVADSNATTTTTERRKCTA